MIWKIAILVRGEWKIERCSEPKFTEYENTFWMRGIAAKLFGILGACC